MQPRLSQRAQAMPASPIRKLAPAAEAAKRRGIHVYHLNIGQPDVETPRPFLEKLAQIHDRVLAYSPSDGTPEFLATLLGYYAKLGIELSRADLLVTTGGSEACLFAMLACANQGDDALVMEPYYSNYAAFGLIAGVRLVPLTTRSEDGFHVPPREDWEKALTPRTKLVLLCNPNNPTGTVYSREELLPIAEFCREHGLFLVSDEVYREFVYDGERAVSALELPGYEDLVVVADSLSKRYSACGIRLGALVTRNHDVREACLRMAQARLCAPGLAQMIACGADELPPEYSADYVAAFRRRRDILYDGLSAIPGVMLRKPEGAFYLMPRLPVDDAEDFARWLLEEFDFEGGTVMIAPAEGFYATPGLGQNEARIAYVLNEEDLRRSVKILERGLEAYQNRTRAAS
jgi:aspartate aminotransferase